MGDGPRLCWCKSTALCYGECVLPGREIPPSTARAQFTTTHWSVVLAAGQDTPDGRQALEPLCRTYWYPLYAYVRRRGYEPEEARDFTQSFFARLLEKDLLARASPERGRFRSFLLTAMQHFLADERDRASALKRGGGQSILSWEELTPEARYAAEPAENCSPDKLFERRWALTILDQAWNRLGEEYRAEGKGELFERLRQFISAEGSGLAYAEAATVLGMVENTVKSHVHRMRRRYRGLLRAEIAQTVADPADVADEIRHLLAVLGSPS